MEPVEGGVRMATRQPMRVRATRSRMLEVTLVERRQQQELTRRIVGLVTMIGEASTWTPAQRVFWRQRVSRARATVQRMTPSAREKMLALDDDRLRSVFKISLDLVGSGDRLTDRQGPWVSAASVMEGLQVGRAALAKQRTAHRILGVRFADRTFYYPSRQFRDGRVIDGLRQVLDALAVGSDDPDTWAAWMAGPADAAEPEGDSMWDLLREGEVDAVVREARRDAARWAA
jgi:hypothetical protein